MSDFRHAFKRPAGWGGGSPACQFGSCTRPEDDPIHAKEVMPPGVPEAATAASASATEPARVADGRAVQWSAPLRVFCERHDEHRAVYTMGRPLMDDTCHTCRMEEAEAKGSAPQKELERVRHQYSDEIGKLRKVIRDLKTQQRERIAGRLYAALVSRADYPRQAAADDAVAMADRLIEALKPWRCHFVGCQLLSAGHIHESGGPDEAKETPA